MSGGSPSEDKLSLFDACGMAIGGMVGGGIFAVLGEGVAQAGNAAFLAFGLAGALAFVTGLSYARLTVSFDEPGGSFTFIEEIAGAAVAGTVSWFLILGYVFTLSLYAYTFGAYAGQLVGFGSTAGLLGAGILLALAGLNLLGVRESGVTEDVLVYGKLAILVAVCALGFVRVESAEAQPVFERSPLGVMAAAALLAASQYRESPGLTWALLGTAAALLVVRGIDLVVGGRSRAGLGICGLPERLRGRRQDLESRSASTWEQVGAGVHGGVE